MIPSRLSNLPYDILRHICAVTSERSEDAQRTTVKHPLDGLSRTNKHLREVFVPQLFHTVTIRCDWEKAETSLEALRHCLTLTPYVKLFKLDIVDRGEPQHPNLEHLPATLAFLLNCFMHLQKLVLVIPEYHTAAFADAFSRGEVTLPTVKTLVLGPYLEFVIASCPNVVAISGDGWRWVHSKRQREERGNRHHSLQLIKAAGRAQKLHHFQILDWWELPLIEAALDAMPNISILGLEGGQYSTKLSQLLPTLSRFRNLQSLVLADASCVGVDFHPPRCGNVYLGPEGLKIREHVRQQRQQAYERIANMVFPVCHELKELWIGDRTRAVVQRGPEGNDVKVTFFDDRRKKID